LARVFGGDGRVGAGGRRAAATMERLRKENATCILFSFILKGVAKISVSRQCRADVERPMAGEFERYRVRCPFCQKRRGSGVGIGCAPEARGGLSGFRCWQCPHVECDRSWCCVCGRALLSPGLVIVHRSCVGRHAHAHMVLLCTRKRTKNDSRTSATPVSRPGVCSSRQPREPRAVRGIIARGLGFRQSSHQRIFFVRHVARRNSCS